MKITSRSPQMQAFLVTTAASVALALAVISQGCAPANQGHGLIQSAQNVPAAAGETGSTAGKLTATAGLLGNYATTFVTSVGGHGEVSSNPVLNIRTEGDRAVFTISGMNGASFTGELSLFKKIEQDGYKAIRLYSRLFDISSVSRQTFSLDLVLTLKNGQFDPSQSIIRILDCGSYQAAPCVLPSGETLAPRDARFEGSLIRQ